MDIPNCRNSLVLLLCLSQVGFTEGGWIEEKGGSFINASSMPYVSLYPSARSYNRLVRDYAIETA